MKVLVNAVSIKEGGPRVVLAKLLQSMQSHRPDTEWCVAAPPGLAKDLDGVPQVTRLAVSVDRSPAHLLKWYEVDLAAAARQQSADVVFSVTNYLPFRRMQLPTLLLEQHAGHFSPEFDKLTREATRSVLGRRLWQWKGRWVRNSVNSATMLTVQTQTLAEAIHTATGRSRDTIRVIPHGPGWVEPLTTARPRRCGEKWRIGYVTKWGVQKNFVTLFKAVKTLGAKGIPISLLLTLDPTHKGSADTLRLASAMGIDAFVDNRGEVAGQRITALYDELDFFVFPSLCESFGVPMVEAMARGLPIVVAGTSENREITGDAGIAFPPYDAGSLADILIELISDDVERKNRIRQSMIRAKEFSWEKAAAATLAAMDEAIGASLA